LFVYLVSLVSSVASSHYVAQAGLGLMVLLPQHRQVALKHMAENIRKKTQKELHWNLSKLKMFASCEQTIHWEKYWQTT
jgi:hypothetical protein